MFEMKILSCPCRHEIGPQICPFIQSSWVDISLEKLGILLVIAALMAIYGLVGQGKQSSENK